MLVAWFIVLAIGLAFRYLARTSSARQVRLTSRFLDACKDAAPGIRAILDSKENVVSERLTVIAAVNVGLGLSCEEALEQAFKYDPAVSKKEFKEELGVTLVKAQPQLLALFQAFKIGESFIH